MKSFRINQSEMLSHDSIERSILKPSRGKRNREDVKAVLDNLESEIEIVCNMVSSGNFKPRKHQTVVINEKNYLKVRRIIKPDFRYEQIVHHLIVQSISDCIMSGMYQYVLGSVPNRGAHMGARSIEKWIKKDPANTKYVLKMDIRHFYESVNHRVLKRWLKKKFRDKFLLELFDVVIAAADMGLPLGYYTSQWFANFLLQPLDHYIKEKLHTKYMTRYVDDIVCLGRNKKELHKVRLAISEYLENELGLTMKGNWQVFRFEYTAEELAITCKSLKELERLGNDLEAKRIRYKSKMHKGKRKIFIKLSGVKNKRELLSSILDKHHATREVLLMVHGRPLDYMGFEFHRNRTVMRESIMLRATKKAVQVSKQEKINPKDAASLLSSMGWIKHTDTYDMFQERIKPIVNIKTLRKVVSKNQRRLNNAVKLENSRGYTARAS